jgi:hypothetical protein
LFNALINAKPTRIARSNIGRIIAVVDTSVSEARIGLARLERV